MDICYHRHIYAHVAVAGNAVARRRERWIRVDAKTDTVEERRDRALLLAYLAGCAVREEMPDPARLEDVDLDALLDLAAKHMLTAVVATALESARLGNDRTREGIARAAWRAAQFEAEWEPVRVELEAAGIWYCPLKGMVIKDLYPAYGMREMGDYDILFDPERAEDVREIMERRGFITQQFSRGCHDTYHKQPILNLEMHRKLFTKSFDHRIDTYFAQTKGRLIKDEDNTFGYHMDVDECYLHLVAHEHKHYADGGTGLRSLLDTYVYLRAYADALDWDRISTTAHSIGLADFEVKNRLLARQLFVADCDSLSDEEQCALNYIAESSVYGTIEHTVFNHVRREGNGIRGKVHYLRSRLFPSIEALQEVYPAFFRRRVFFPALFVYRIGRALTVKRKYVVTEFKSLHRTGREDNGAQLQQTHRK